MNSGCGTTPKQRTYTSIGITITSVETAMKLWNNWVGLGKATIEDEIKVRGLYEKYQASMRLLKLVVISQQNETGEIAETAIDNIIKTTEIARLEVINLIVLLTK